MRVNKTIIAFIMSTAMLSACSSTEEKDQSILDGGTPNGTTDAYQNGMDISGEQFGSGADPRFSNPANPLSKQTIYFMYDSSQVQQEFIRVVAAHSQYLLGHPSEHIILEGHADERGSREYNIALGEQRAKSILRMMKVQGVSNNQVEVVSYGEEKPASNGMDEAAWQMNRRVEIVYQGR
ncbi:MAG: peptidoglycan-associated lipoprotein Pal [Methylococcales symbiont of Hymedesmia sp. n. MRB-2018]|nr:MAG: peptidoglycan-associated lipoprotein Pal [Methylococcales symbiont of Hymedesmia sp. n. MRB-2018]